jgi:diguanylate cyclase (GGDEF)-like protein/PAS domain S-box-containing protein
MASDSTESGVEKLAELLDRIPDLFRQTWDAAALYRVDGTMLRGNRVASTMVGGVNFAGQHFFTHMSPEARERAQREFAEAISTDTPREFESVFATPDGSEIEVEIRLLPAHLDGLVVGVFGLARDISARKRAEREVFRGQQQMLALFENHPDSITLLDSDGRYQLVNRASVALTGYAAPEFVGKTITEVFDPQHPDHYAFLLDAIARGEPLAYDTHTVTKDGRNIAIEGTLIPIRVDGDLTGAFNAAKDVTAKRQYESRLSRDGDRLRHLYQIASTVGISPQQRTERALRDGMGQLRADSAFLSRIRKNVVTVEAAVGDGFGLDIGYTTDIEKSFARHVSAEPGGFLHIEDLHTAEWVDDPARQANTAWRGFVGVRLMVGDQLYGIAGFMTKNRPFTLEETDREYISAVVALIALSVERSVQYQRLNDLAHQDTLTGLPNRALLLDRLDQTLLQARRFNRPFAVHFLDFDDFKDVNDQFGHAAGDELLIATTAAMAKSLRESDTLARVGGDEFVVLQPEIRSIEDANASRERLCSALDRTFTLEKSVVQISVSAGTAVFPQDGNDAAALLEAADQALYRAKAQRRSLAETAGTNGVSAGIATTSYASLHHLICDCGHTAFSHGARGCRVPKSDDGKVQLCGCTRTLENIYAHSAPRRRRQSELRQSPIDL